MQKTGFKQNYFCTQLTDLVSEFLKALDIFLVKKASPDLEIIANYNDSDNDLRHRNLQNLFSREQSPVTKLTVGKVSKYTFVDEIKLALSNVTLLEYYSVRLLVSRSNLRVELIQTDDSLGSIIHITLAKTYKLLSRDRPRQFIDIPLHKIKEIILDHFGFRVWVHDSGQVYSFLHLEIDRKAQLVNIIKENAHRYMKTTIPITVTESSSSSIVDTD